jgi:hypothetical protein
VAAAERLPGWHSVVGQPGITLVDPLVSTTRGVLVFGEQIRQGPLLWLAALPAVAMIAGALVLARSPGMQLTQGEGAGKRGQAVARAG